MSTIDEKFGVYYRDPFGIINHAAKYYRILVPARMLSEKYKAAVFVDDERVKKELSIQAAINSDMAVMYNGTGEQIGSIVEVIKAMKVGRGQDGEPIHPPSVVYDIDDNIDFVHPFNDAYNRFGTRLPDGSLLEPSDDPEHPTEISTTLANGEVISIWKDGVTPIDDGGYFDIVGNRRRIDSCHSVAKMCHGVTVPSEALAAYYRDVHNCKNVYVFPNTVVKQDYHFPNLLPRDKEVRILWQGGMSHYPDWHPLRYAIQSVAKKYPHATFVIWGTKFDWITNVIPEKQLEYHEWTDYAAYKMKRSIMDCDINLAPLADAPFNWCKSGIKFYEASIGPRPEATLAANVQPYSLEIEDGKTGLLYNDPEDFAYKLGLLIEDATLRKNLAAGAKTWVEANRTPDATIPGLAEFYEELRRQRRLEALAL